MIPWYYWPFSTHRQPVPDDPRLKPVDGDEIDELVNWQLSKETP